MNGKKLSARKRTVSWGLSKMPGSNVSFAVGVCHCSSSDAVDDSDPEPITIL